MPTKLLRRFYKPLQTIQKGIVENYILPVAHDCKTKYFMSHVALHYGRYLKDLGFDVENHYPLNCHQLPNEIVEFAMYAYRFKDAALHYHFVSEIREMVIEGKQFFNRDMIIRLWTITQREDPLRKLVLDMCYLRLVVLPWSRGSLLQELAGDLNTWEYGNEGWLYDFAVLVIERADFSMFCHDKDEADYRKKLYAAPYCLENALELHKWLDHICLLRIEGIIKDEKFFTVRPSKFSSDEDKAQYAYHDACKRGYTMPHQLPFVLPQLKATEGQSLEELRALVRAIDDSNEKPAHLITASSPSQKVDSNDAAGDSPSSGAANPGSKRKPLDPGDDDDDNDAARKRLDPSLCLAPVVPKKIRKRDTMTDTSASRTPAASYGSGGPPVDETTNTSNIKIHCSDGIVMFPKNGLKDEIIESAQRYGGYNMLSRSTSHLVSIQAFIEKDNDASFHSKRLTDQLLVVITAEDLGLEGTAQSILEKHVKPVFTKRIMDRKLAVWIYAQARSTVSLLRNFACLCLHYVFIMRESIGKKRPEIMDIRRPDGFGKKAWEDAHDELDSDLDEADRSVTGPPEEHPASGMAWEKGGSGRRARASGEQSGGEQKGV